MRQIQKYLDLSVDEKDSDEMTIETTKKPAPPAVEFYLNQHMHTLDNKWIKHTLEQMIRHGFCTGILDDLDPFQLNQLIWECSEIFKNVHYPHNYPSEQIDGSYTDLGKRFVIPKEQFQRVKYAL